MQSRLRLLCSFAHPDDESLGMGGTLARYAADEQIDAYLVSATRGERGWQGVPAPKPNVQEMGRIRTGELLSAAKTLGIDDVAFLDYIDGELDQADPHEAVTRLTSQVRRIRPHVVVTFSPDGHYGHPDHIAISQLTQAAVMCAASADYADPLGQSPHCVSKLYYMVGSVTFAALFTQVVGEIKFPVDGVEREFAGWPEWQITTRIATSDYWATAWQAVQCHATQLPSLGNLAALSEEMQRRMWQFGTFYRAFSLVNGGRQVESDLFAGLR